MQHLNPIYSQIIKLQQIQIYQIMQSSSNSSEHRKNQRLIALKKMNRNINSNIRVKIDLTKTDYPIIRQVALTTMNWKLWSKQDQKDDVNIFWNDTYITDQFAKKLRSYQRVNHFPSSFQIGRKNNLAINLNRLKKLFPEEYKFYPQTWILPRDLQQLKKVITLNQNHNRYYIAKPEADSQGRGIFLFNKIDQVSNNQSLIAQEYIHSPLLIDGFKFDLRIYVLVKSLTPLKIFVYKQGLARLATNIYQDPAKQNSSNLMMHLTNYAINKKSPNFIFNNSETQDNIGHKRSYSAVMDLLKQKGNDVAKLQNQIDQIIVKTILSGYQSMLSKYRECRNTKQIYSVCFQILGFDIMIDQNLKAYLIEVNHTPSFTTDTPLDLTIKKNLILDSLNILNISHEQKKQFLKTKDSSIQERQMTLNYVKNKLLDQYQFQNKHMGAYRRIYPSNHNHNMTIYNNIINRIQQQSFSKINKKIKYHYKNQSEHKDQIQTAAVYCSIQKTIKISSKSKQLRDIWTKSAGLSLPVSVKIDNSQNDKKILKNSSIDGSLKKYRVRQKKKNNLSSIKLNSTEIQFVTGNYQTFSIFKPSYASFIFNGQQLISDSFLKQTSNLKGHSKRNSVFNLDKNIVNEKLKVDSRGTILYQSSQKNNVQKGNIANIPKIRFHKINNFKANSILKRIKHKEIYKNYDHIIASFRQKQI